MLDQLEIVIRLATAVGLGGLLGLQRNLIGKAAGMRTFALISLGSALFVVISELILSTHSGDFDPLRTASQVVVGIGFLGAGLILIQGNKVTGLTTAAGIWVAAGIGLAAGFGLYFVGTVATALALLVFTILWYLEQGIDETIKTPDATHETGREN